MAFWAKTTGDGQPGMSVRDHCLNVGCVAETLIKLLPSRLQDLLPPGVVTLAALHDIGKITPGFQAKCSAWMKDQQLVVAKALGYGNESNHARVSHYFLQDKVHRCWAVAVGAHHGRVLDTHSKPICICESESKVFADFRNELFGWLEELLGPLPHLEKPKESLRWFVAGLITVADWIGSNECYFPLEWPEQENPQLNQRREQAIRSLFAIGWKYESPTVDLTFQSLFAPENKNDSFEPNPLQQAVDQHITAPGLYLIEGPMGCGKTEAALLAAYNLISKGYHHGIYFGLPTQVTSNRIYTRMEKFLERSHSNVALPALLLTHANSWLRDTSIALRSSFSQQVKKDEDNSRSALSWFMPKKRSLLAQYGVGTIDQALLSIVGAKFFFVRQFGLAGKVIILDEVHSYDLYTGTLIDKLIQRLLDLKCTVLVLSATLTEERRRLLLNLVGNCSKSLSQSYPLLSGAREGGDVFEVEIPEFQSRSINITCEQISLQERVEQCLTKAQAGACVLWIRNTVDEAQETWRMLKSNNLEDGPEIGLLHSRFPFWRREQLEEKWIKALGKGTTYRPRGCVLVSTQVVEQSVDIDADYLITDLAPTDMLLQRLGRLWRHDRPERPLSRAEARINAPDLGRLNAEKDIYEALGKSGRVYAPYVLLRSWQCWSTRSQIEIPTDIRRLLEHTYNKGEESEPKVWSHFETEIDDFRNKQQSLAESATHVGQDPTLDDDESVQTRWSRQPTASLVLLHSLEEVSCHEVEIVPLHGEQIRFNINTKSLAVARVLHENIVKVPYRSVEEACRASSHAWLSDYVQGACAVAIVVNGELRMGKEGTRAVLFWQEDEGIIISKPNSVSQQDNNELESCD